MEEVEDQTWARYRLAAQACCLPMQSPGMVQLPSPSPSPSSAQSSSSASAPDSDSSSPSSLSVQGLLVLPPRAESLTHGVYRLIYRRGAGGDVVNVEALKCRQRAAAERGGEGGAAFVGDLGAGEMEQLERRQPSGRRRRRTCRRRRRHEGGEALIAERVARETETLQRGPPPQAGAPPPPTGGMTKLKLLELGGTQIADAGCATLAAARDSGALPALEYLSLFGIHASPAAKAAVRRAGSHELA